MKKSWLIFFAALLLLDITEILKVYYIMPMPGSQLADHVELAYGINKYIWLTRTISIVLLLFSGAKLLLGQRLWKKVVAVILIIISGGIFYLTNYVMLADKMFYQPRNVSMYAYDISAVNTNKLVICIEENGDAKAYPVYIIGYHHQIRDSLNHRSVMVTYCTVCRTGRVYRPEVDGREETFRLVGMDQFNAMFEDSTTHSWWRQATGECCAGPLKGKRLQEVPSAQMRLATWHSLYPGTFILQEDPQFAVRYKSLANYDQGNYKSSLEGSDSTVHHKKSWVIEVSSPQGVKEYDWYNLKENGMINDSIGSEPILLVLNKDNTSFRSFDRNVNGQVLDFKWNSVRSFLEDTGTSSSWNMKGECIEGKMKGEKLKPVQSYQEFNHYFQAFHPRNRIYGK